MTTELYIILYEQPTCLFVGPFNPRDIKEVQKINLEQLYGRGSLYYHDTKEGPLNVSRKITPNMLSQRHSGDFFGRTGG